MFVTIILCERFGSPIMKSVSVVIGLLTGCIIAAACGYFDGSGIDEAPAVSFIWVHTFKLSVYGPHGVAPHGRFHHLRLRGYR